MKGKSDATTIIQSLSFDLVNIFSVNKREDKNQGKIFNKLYWDKDSLFFLLRSLYI